MCVCVYIYIYIYIYKYIKKPPIHLLFSLHKCLFDENSKGIYN